MSSLHFKRASVYLNILCLWCFISW